MTLRVRSLPVDPHRGSIPPEGAAPGSGSGPGVVPRNSAKEPAPGLLKARGMRADLIALLAGALAALALPPLHVLPVLLVSFPVLLAQINAARGFFEAARRGWWFGFGYHLIGLYWITEAILFEAARFWWLVPLAVPATYSSAPLPTVVLTVVPPDETVWVDSPLSVVETARP